MRNNSGSYYMDRKWLDNPILQKHPHRIAVWSTIIALAAWKDQDKEVIHNGKKILLKRGQLITGLSELSSFTGVSIAGIDKILKIFEKDGMCVNEVNTKGRIITVVKYEYYQDACKRSRNEVETECKRSRNEVEGTNKVNKVQESKENKECLCGPEPKTETMPISSIIEKDREELLNAEIYDASSFLDFYYECLNRMHIERPVALDGKQAQAELYYAEQIINNLIVSKEDLKKSVYGYISKRCLNQTSKHAYITKQFSSVMLWMKVVYGYLISQGIVKKTQKVQENDKMVLNNPLQGAFYYKQQQL